MAAHAAARARAAAERASCATSRTSSRRRSPRCAKAPSSCATTSAASSRAEQQEIVRIVRENTLSLQKLIEDLLTLPPDARDGAGDASGRSRCADVVRRVLREQKLAALARMIDVRHAARRRAIVVGDAEQDPHDRRQPRVERDQVFAALRRRSTSTLGRDDGLRRARRGRPRARHRRRRARARVRLVLSRASRPPTGRVKGSGLGLAIAREYALAHGGRIEVARPRRRRARRALPAVAAARAGAARRGAERARRRSRRRASNERAAPRCVARRVRWLAGCASLPPTSPSDITLTTTTSRR